MMVIATLVTSFIPSYLMSRENNPLNLSEQPCASFSNREDCHIFVSGKAYPMTVSANIKDLVCKSCPEFG